MNVIVEDTRFRVLTIRQPWIDAIFSDGKDIENRTWNTGYRGRVYLHAAAALSKPGIGFLGLNQRQDRDRGMLLGFGFLQSVHEAGSEICDAHGCPENPWAMWPILGGKMFHWHIEHPRRLITPIKMNGKLGLWDLDPEFRHRVETADLEPLDMFGRS